MKELRAAVMLVAVMTLVTGVLYPLAVTIVAQAAFPFQANGSLLVKDGLVLGSRLIARPSDDPALFWSRPSAAAPAPNSPASLGHEVTASAASNLAPTNPALLEAVRGRVAALAAASRSAGVSPASDSAPTPGNLATASGSGLDPDITPAGALFQVPRVARVRNLPVAEVAALVRRQTQEPVLGLLGARRVNVLELNLALGRMSKRPSLPSPSGPSRERLASGQPQERQDRGTIPASHR